MRKLPFVATLAALFASALCAQIPETPAGRQFSAWLAAFNSGDRAVMQQYFDKSMTFGRIDQDMAIRARTGGFDVKKVEESADTRIVVLCQERGPGEQFTRIMMSVAPAEPHNVAGLRFGPAQPPADLAPPKMTPAEIEAARKAAPFLQFSAWLDTFNSGDRARIEKYLQVNYPQRSIDAEMNFRGRVNGFEYRTIEHATPVTVVGLAQERDSDQFVRFNLQIEPDEPHKIVRFSLLTIPRPAEFPLPHMNDAELVAALGARLEKDAAADRFAGAFLVARNGKVLAKGAYGLADREKKIANRVDTRFRIGSMNKMFTATAVMQLVQGGKIKLTDPMGQYITDYPNQDIATKVTIHHLLTHTGGTGDFFGPEYNAHRLELKALNDYVALFGKRAPAFAAGSQWAYSNYGMILLGVVIERVTGQSYYEYVAEHVYKPAGMTLTGSEPESETVPNRAVGYMRSPGGGWTPNTNTLPYRGTSAGGGYCTVGDLLKFADALLGHKLLNAENTDLLITGKVDSGGGRKYAYGFEDGRGKDGAGAVGHSGGAPGMNGDLRIYPKSGYIVAVLSNLDPPAAMQVSDFVGLRLENSGRSQ